MLHDEGEREREAMELQRYRAMEAARENWEAREQRVADELDRVREELSGYKGKAGGVGLKAMSGQLAAAELELQEVREEAKGSKRDKEVLQLEREELKAELALGSGGWRGQGVWRTGVEGCGRHRDRHGEREPWRR